MALISETTASHIPGNYKLNVHSRENVNLSSVVLTPVREQQEVNGHQVGSNLTKFSLFCSVTEVDIDVVYWNKLLICFYKLRLTKRSYSQSRY